ncbi:DNA recombination protein RmuC [Quadrisphaera sp. DSM 44207]|uniref:DNA recombination protein RmuC n=1 Tax=Quadrisphaera sp. DSM 44207 TaxID=1881057 RepID=UPI000885DD53|nr:DNA recombination protein RmuC [Quadrisphaera sp. DSM 44207]SDQ69848.1 DNA recombination protein RmuC [Quadrisphaera sp. DSM 44207]
MDPAVLAAVLLALLVGLGAGWSAGGARARSRDVAGRAALAAERDLLRQRVAHLEDSAAEDMTVAAALAPVSSSVARLERQVETLERERAEQYGRIGAQLMAVQASGEALRNQTAALAGALRSPNARGAWGEVQLRRVVEHAGMLERVDFEVQVSATTRDGAPVRPDAVVRLPGGKQVVVDAKAPMAAFLEASAAGSAGGQRRAAAAALEHARALRGHVDALAAKQYWTAFEPTPEIVVCFVPGEAFLAAACEADPALLEHAMGRRVVLATPTTLLALLRTVALTWQQAALSDGARELFDLGRELHARLATLGEHTGKLGRTLGRAVEDYNRLVGTLEQRVLVSARRMGQLDLTDARIDLVTPVEAAARPLTAPELLLPAQAHEGP